MWRKRIVSPTLQNAYFADLEDIEAIFADFFLFQNHINSSAASSNLFSVFYYVNFSLIVSVQTFFIVKKKFHMRLPKLNLHLSIIKRQQGKNTGRKWHG